MSARWVCLSAPVPLCLSALEPLYPANFYRVCLGGSLTGLCSLLCACLPGKFLFSLQRCTVLLSVAANWRHTQFITVTQCCCADWEAFLNWYYALFDTVLYCNLNLNFHVFCEKSVFSEPQSLSQREPCQTIKSATVY